LPEPLAMSGARMTGHASSKKGSAVLRDTLS
jgi:hypothetical protein